RGSVPLVGPTSTRGRVAASPMTVTRGGRRSTCCATKTAKLRTDDDGCPQEENVEDEEPQPARFGVEAVEPASQRLPAVPAGQAPGGGGRHGGWGGRPPGNGGGGGGCPFRL